VLFILSTCVNCEPSKWCPQLHKRSVGYCQPCLLPGDLDDLCEAGLTCNNYMRRCVRRGNLNYESHDHDKLQRICPEKINDRSTYWARCINNNCLAGNPDQVCPQMCVNPDYPCYWVKRCQMSPMLEDHCERSCADKSNQLSKANEFLWKLDKDFFKDCPTAAASNSCTAAYGREIRYYCPYECKTGECEQRCDEMLHPEESRGEDGRCLHIVPNKMTCEEATLQGYDCHCRCPEVYRALGKNGVILNLKLKRYVVSYFDLHVTGVRLQKTVSIQGSEARVKIVAEDVTCSKNPSPFVDGTGCKGPETSECHTSPAHNALYYQRWDGIRIRACGKFKICYCGYSCKKGIGKWAESGTIEVVRDRGDGWTYQPGDNCWDGPFKIDYPGPVDQKVETAEKDEISAVFALCGVENEWEPFRETLARYLKHRSLKKARPKDPADFRMEERPKFTILEKGPIVRKVCSMRDIIITTHSEESKQHMLEKLEDLDADISPLEDTFFFDMWEAPEKLKLVLVTHGSLLKTKKALGLYIEEELEDGEGTVYRPPENEKDFWATPIGITIVIVGSVVLGGTSIFVLWHLCVSVCCKRKEANAEKTAPEDEDEEKEGKEEKEEKTPKKKKKKRISKTKNPFKKLYRLVKSILEDVIQLIKKKRAPKVYKRNEAPKKWIGATEDLEEVPCNCPPYAGAVVRISGLNAVEYNGLRGIVTSGPNEKERYIVDVVLTEEPRETKEMSLKPDNLMVVKEIVKRGDSVHDSWRTPMTKSKYFSDHLPNVPDTNGDSDDSPHSTKIRVKPAPPPPGKTYRKKEDKEDKEDKEEKKGEKEENNENNEKDV